MKSIVALARLAAMVAFSVVVVPLALLVSLTGSLTGHRGRARSLRFLTRFTSLWSRVLLYLLRVTVITSSPLPQRAGLITSNHLSYIDILVISALFPSRFIAKQEIASWPVIGLLTRSVGTLFLARGKNRDVARMGNEIRDTLAAGISVVFFPEGGITDGTSVQPFFGGLLESAAQTSIECLPVCLYYDTEDEAAPPAEVVGWWNKMPFQAHLWRLLRTGRVRAEVRWATTPIVDTDRKRLAARLHRETLAMFRPLRR